MTQCSTKKFHLKIWHKSCMYKKVIWLFFLWIMLLCNGCNANGMDSVPIEDDATLQLEPMTFVSGTLNSSWVRIATAITGKANAYFYGYPITVTTGGAIANPYSIQKGQADIGLSQKFFLVKALAEETPYEGSLDNIRAIASLETRALYFIADHELGIQSLGEAIDRLNNLKLGTLPQTDTSQMAMNAVFAEYGINDIKKIQAPGAGVYLAEGSALFKAYSDSYFDCLVLHEALNDSSISELMIKRASVILSLDQEIINSLRQKYGWVSLTIPAGTYPGQTEDVLTVGIPSILLVHKDIPDEAAYYLTKTIYENKAYLETIQDSYKDFKIDDMLKHLVVPIHPGAKQFYKEVGLMENWEVLQ